MTQHEFVTHARKGKARPDSHNILSRGGNVNIVIGIRYYQERSVY